jgi:predicted dehydrogenase
MASTELALDGELPVAPLPRVALVGVHGFGLHHLANLDRLEASGALKLVAVADPHPPAPGQVADDVRIFGTLDELLRDGVSPDVVIIATPIQSHAPLGLAALAAGAHVYLEKPTAASMAQFRELRDAAAKAGKSIQVGFQSLGSLALPALQATIEDGGIGTVRGISATGTWLRDKAYYQRSRWAGKRTIAGVDVVDGVTTNPLAHAVATALHIAGIHSADAIHSVETDLYRAHDIEGDDTSVVRITPASGPVVVSALTVCAPEQTAPFVTVHGTTGTAVFHYTEDILELTTEAGTTRRVFARTDLLENLLAHCADGTPLLSSLENSGAFMSVLEAVRTAEDPAPIAAEHIQWLGEGAASHPVVADIGAWIVRATAAQATFSELGAPWARPTPGTEQITIGGTVVAGEISGENLAAALSPRPYLHPVTTLAGTIVTDAMPADHVWHLGVGVALQDVNGVNFWGGRTYRRDQAGYVWRPDHGRIVRTGSRDSGDTRTQSLAWTGPGGTKLLHETRHWAWRDAGDGAWRLTLSFTLTPAGTTPVSLGSPGSNGRDAGGYGGFFWRLPAVENASVRTLFASGEAAVHGGRAPWLAWTGDFAGKPATLVFTAPPESDDPWFVRVDGYPGVGSALAWDTAVVLAPGEQLTRTIAVTIADGIATDNQINEWAGTK